MIRRKWQGDPTCYFCHMNESVSHLLFHCNIAQAVWATFATCIGARDIPRTLEQCWAWCEKWVGGSSFIHLELQLCAGLFGMQGISCALRAR